MLNDILLCTIMIFSTNIDRQRRETLRKINNAVRSSLITSKCWARIGHELRNGDQISCVVDGVPVNGTVMMEKHQLTVEMTSPIRLYSVPKTHTGNSPGLCDHFEDIRLSKQILLELYRDYLMIYRNRNQIMHKMSLFPRFMKEYLEDENIRRGTVNRQMDELSFRLKELRKQKQHGEITDEGYRIQANPIRKQMAELMDKLEVPDFFELYFVTELDMITHAADKKGLIWKMSEHSPIF